MSVQDSGDYYRYCPGEEQIRISDAVCRGRRRSHFPKCRGCQFNDDEKSKRAAFVPLTAAIATAINTRAGSATAVVATSASSGAGIATLVEPAVAVTAGLTYREAAIDAAVSESGASQSAGASNAAMVDADSPRRRLDELFRASDIRGLFPVPLSADAAWRIGHAAAQFLRSKLKGYDRADPRSRTVVTACDLRSASAMLHTSMVAGIRTSGVTVNDIGAVDTPQLYFAVRHFGAGGGIITTGGRSPAAYSGFKVCGAGGRDVSMETGLADIRDIAGRVPRHETGTLAGRFETDLSEPYREFVRRFMPAALSSPLKIVIDASDGVAGRWAPRLFSEVEGLSLILLNDGGAEPFAHEPDPTDPQTLAGLRRAIKRERADLGVCFDGDADACVFLDERGVRVHQDLVVAMLARHALERCGGGTVVVDQRCSRVVSEEVERAGGVVRRERPQSSAVRKSMIETDAVFGATLTGQFFFRDNGMCESAFIAVAQMIAILSTSPCRLGDRLRPLARYKTSGDRRLPADDPTAALARVAAHYGAQAEPLPDGLTIRDADWALHLCRIASEPALSLRAEATSTDLLREKIKELESVLRAPADDDGERRDEGNPIPDR